MIPIRLSLSGFLSYRDPVEVDFTSFDLACIAGLNGAGKSSILDAITWVLFGQARQRGDAVINTQSESAEVVLVFQYERNLYQVQRTNQRAKTGLLEFHIAPGEQYLVDSAQLPLDDAISAIQWKPLTERTMRDTQASLERILRLDYDTFVNAAFFLQGKADQFTQQRPGDRKRILANILGLEVWEHYRKGAVEHRKSIESQMTAMDGRLVEINAELSEEDARKQRFGELEAELERLVNARQNQQEALDAVQKTIDLLEDQQKMVASRAQGLSASKSRLEGLTSKLGTREEERANYAQTLSRSDEIEAAHRRWGKLKEELKRWDEIAEQFREHEKRRQEPLTTIEAERARLTQELEGLLEREKAVSDQWSAVRDSGPQFESTQASIADLQKQLDEGKSLDAELIDAQEQLANAKAENPRLRSEMEQLKARIDRLAETDGSESVCPLCGQPLAADERQRLVEELGFQGKEMGDKYRANSKLLEDADQLVAGLRSKLVDIRAVEPALHEYTRQLEKLTADLSLAEALKAEFEKQAQPRMEQIKQGLKSGNFAPEAKQALAEIDAELKAIGYDAAAHDQTRRAADEASSVDEEQRLLEKAQAASEPLAREIADLANQIEEISTEIQQQEDAHTEAAANLAAAEEQAPDLRSAQRDLLDMQEKENQLRMEVGAAQQKVLVLDDLKDRRTSLDADREVLARKIGQYKQLETAFGKDGVPALLIEQALPTIEMRANELLDRLSGGEMSISFETQRELKTRENLKETLDIQIRDRVGVRDYEMFSGGEAFRVNFAIRLALSETLAQRAGARLQTLVIDEGFGSQDEIGRQRLLESINLVKADFAKILVITHIDELKDAFQARIEVEKTERGSVVRVV
jgi:DNA repair protein SbcC/Rad50